MEGTENNVISFLKGIYELESLKRRINKFFIEKGNITEDDCSFAIKPKFSAKGSIKEIRPSRGYHVSFVQDATLRDLLGYKPCVKQEKNNVSDNPIDLSRFDKIFLAIDLAQGVIFKAK